MVDVAFWGKSKGQFVGEDVGELGEQGCDAGVLVIDQKVARGGEFGQEHLGVIVGGKGL